jgi:hypothetical protein
MLRRVRFVLISAVLTVVCGAVPAAAGSCVWVGQVKYCFP